jgi:hypothetical protein
MGMWVLRVAIALTLIAVISGLFAFQIILVSSLLEAARLIFFAAGTLAVPAFMVAWIKLPHDSSS